MSISSFFQLVYFQDSSMTVQLAEKQCLEYLVIFEYDKRLDDDKNKSKNEGPSKWIFILTVRFRMNPVGDFQP